MGILISAVAASLLLATLIALAELVVRIRQSSRERMRKQRLLAQEARILAARIRQENEMTVGTIKPPPCVTIPSPAFCTPAPIPDTNVITG